MRGVKVVLNHRAKSCFAMVGLLVFAILPSAFGASAFPFMERLKLGFQDGAKCGRLATGSSFDPARRLKERQTDLDRTYDFSRPPGEIKDFLLFASHMQHRGYRMLDSIMIAEPQRSGVVRSDLVQFQDDLTLIKKFLTAVVRFYPGLTKTFIRSTKSIGEIEGLLNRALVFFEKNRRDRFYPQEVLDDMHYRIEDELGIFVGSLGELQVGLRLTSVRKASFSLAELLPATLIPGATLIEKAKSLAKIEGVRGILAEIPANYLNNNIVGTDLERRAHYALDKEFDFLLPNGLTGQTWIEVKNFGKQFLLADLEGPRGTKVLKQISNSIIIRKIMLKLQPTIPVRLEFHFLQGISKDARRELESHFESNMGIVTGAHR